MKLKIQCHMKATFTNDKETKSKTLYYTLHFPAKYLEGHRRETVCCNTCIVKQLPLFCLLL